MTKREVEIEIEKALKRIVTKGKIGNGKVEAGQKIGKFTLIKIVKQTPSSGDWIWRCICECGNRVKRSQRYLLEKQKKGIESDCGCWKIEGRRLANCPKCKEEHYTPHEEDNWCQKCRVKQPIREKIYKLRAECATSTTFICSNCQVKHAKDWQDGFDYCVQCRKLGKIRKIVPTVKPRRIEIEQLRTIDEVKILRVPNNLIKIMSIKDLLASYVARWEVAKGEKMNNELMNAVHARIVLAYHKRQVGLYD
jgi:hypothetical protein